MLQEMTTAQRVAVLRERKRRERYQRSTLCKLQRVLPVVDSIMTETFPTGWLWCKFAAGVAGYVGLMYVMGCICMLMTGAPLE